MLIFHRDLPKRAVQGEAESRSASDQLHLQKAKNQVQGHKLKRLLILLQPVPEPRYIVISDNKYNIFIRLQKKSLNIEDIHFKGISKFLLSS